MTATLPIAQASDRPSRSSSRIEDQVVELFDQWRDPLLRYVLSFGLPVHDSEEVVQEVFLALFRHLQAGRPDFNLRAWLFRVAHNLALKHRQSMRNDSEPLLEDAADQTRDTAPTPEQLAVAKQTGRRMRAAVEKLTEHDRRCLHLRAEGLRYREIASVLGISLGSVANSLARSLGKLRRVEQG